MWCEKVTYGLLRRRFRVCLNTLRLMHKENPTRCNNVSEFYFIFVWSSTCFGRDTAHHQEPKTALAASGFAYVEGCWTCGCWTLTASSNHTPNTSKISAGERPAAAHLLRSWVRIPPGSWIFVCCECRVLSGRGLCDDWTLVQRSPTDCAASSCVI